jgi:hypothetical protein
MIADLAVPNDAMMMIAPGQSGSSLFGHFFVLPRRWRDSA